MVDAQDGLDTALVHRREVGPVAAEAVAASVFVPHAAAVFEVDAGTRHEAVIGGHRLLTAFREQRYGGQ
jgi:hypothetical protein